MKAKNPEEICQIFKECMAKGDLDSVMSVYDTDAVFVNQSGNITKSREELEQELGPFAAMKARFDYDIKRIVQAGDIALMHTEWEVAGPQPMKVYAIEVARRQTDGSWRWLIGDPFTVGKRFGNNGS